jgi:hypothetical protein
MPPSAAGCAGTNKKPAEPIAVRVFGYCSIALRNYLEASRETEMVGAERLELPTYAL